MSYSLLRPGPEGMETVGRFDTYAAARAASQAGHEYTYAEVVSSSYVDIEDAQGRTLYLMTWTADEVDREA